MITERIKKLLDDRLQDPFLSGSKILVMQSASDENGGYTKQILLVFSVDSITTDTEVKCYLKTLFDDITLYRGKSLSEAVYAYNNLEAPPRTPVEGG